jgi:sarcosine oxidase delta subunit
MTGILDSDTRREVIEIALMHSEKCRQWTDAERRQLAEEIDNILTDAEGPIPEEAEAL